MFIGNFYFLGSDSTILLHHTIITNRKFAAKLFGQHNDCMRNRHSVIYVPGLGDEHDRGQSLALKLWNFYGLKAECFRIGWAGNTPFDEKLKKLHSRVKALSQVGTVSLVGASAGATAVINEFSFGQNDIHRMVCIAGKLKNFDTITDQTYAHNPNFRRSIELVPESLQKLSDTDRGNILTLVPASDNIVPVQDAVIDGVESREIPVQGHAFAIGYALTIGSKLIADFLNNKY